MRLLSSLSAVALVLYLAQSVQAQEVPEIDLQSVASAEQPAGEETVADAGKPAVDDIAAPSEPSSEQEEAVAEIAEPAVGLAEEGDPKPELSDLAAEEVEPLNDGDSAKDLEDVPVELAADPQPAEAIVDVDLLLMPTKAEVMFITTGGAELRADWSEAAQANLTTHLEAYVASEGLTTIAFDEEAEKSEELEQLLLLAEVVRNSASLNLPHKPKTTGNSLLSGNNRQDLTLGENVSLLQDAYGADQVIFVDHYSQIESGGVFMAQVLIGAATGYVPVSQNFRGTVATVIDLETGKIVSRNFTTMGDSRDVGESKGIVTRLMKKVEFK